MNDFTISLNGRLLQTQAPTLQALLQQQAYPLDGAIACAVNQVFVPRLRWTEQVLQADDRIDVISPVTGG
jgi:sulfur carrier protein